MKKEEWLSTLSTPGYLHKLITLQPTSATRSSSSVTLLQPSVVSSLKITNRSFSHAAPRLWIKLPSYLRTPFYHCHHDPPCDTPVNSAVTAGSNSHPPLHLFHSSFHSHLKTYLFSNSFSCSLTFPWTALLDFNPSSTLDFCFRTTVCSLRVRQIKLARSALWRTII